MHIPRFHLVAALVLALGAAVLSPPPAAAQYEDQTDVSVFYEELDEGGEWFQHPRWGYVWRPEVDEQWRPYTQGRWVYTDDHGWFWDFLRNPGPGRSTTMAAGPSMTKTVGSWVPGTRWAPAWVAWRHGTDFIGWAPLPPDARWQEELGIVFETDFYDDAFYDPYWVFVTPRFFAYDHVYRYARPRGRNRYYIGRTRPSTHYGYSKRRIFNRGIDARTYRRLTRRNLPRTKVYISGQPGGKGYGARSRQGSIQLYRPGKKRYNGSQRLKAPRTVNKTHKWRGAPPRRVTGPATFGAGKKPPPSVKKQGKGQSPSSNDQPKFGTTNKQYQKPAGFRPPGTPNTKAGKESTYTPTAPPNQGPTGNKKGNKKNGNKDARDNRKNSPRVQGPGGKNSPNGNAQGKRKAESNQNQKKKKDKD